MTAANVTLRVVTEEHSLTDTRALRPDGCSVRTLEECWLIRAEILTDDPILLQAGRPRRAYRIQAETVRLSWGSTATTTTAQGDQGTTRKVVKEDAPTIQVGGRRVLATGKLSLASTSTLYRMDGQPMAVWNRHLEPLPEALLAEIRKLLP